MVLSAGVLLATLLDIGFKQCHQLLPQTRIYLEQNPEDVNYPGEELRAIVGNSSVDQLMK